MQVRQVLQGDGPLLRAAGLSGCPGTLVLEKDGTAIGAALREGEWIKAVYIAPEWRGRGYGTFLLRRGAGVFEKVRVCRRRAGAVPRGARRGR